MEEAVANLIPFALPLLAFLCLAATALILLNKLLARWVTRRKAFLVTMGIGVLPLMGYAVLTASSGRPSHEEIEREIERWTKVDVPSDFSILDRDYSYAVGDDLYEATIEYPAESYRKFLASIDTTKWHRLESGYQLVLSQEIGTRRVDSFLLTISPTKDRKLHIQYGSD